MGDVWLAWSLDQLLWATRGRSWDFRFLTKAADLNPLSIYEAVFSRREASSPVLEDVPQFFLAEAINSRGVACWVMAARFLDPDKDCRDESGRRIPHEIVLFCEKAAMPDPCTAPADWHLQVFQHLSPTYRDLYWLNSGDDAVVPRQGVEPSEIVKKESSAAAMWIELGTLASVGLLNHRTDLAGIVGEGGRRRRVLARVLVWGAAIVLLIIGVVALATMNSQRARKHVLPKSKPRRETVEPAPVRPRSETGKAPLDGGPVLRAKERSGDGATPQAASPQS